MVCNVATRTLDDERGWLILRRSGLSAQEIAREAGLTERRIRQGIQRARQQEGQLSPSVSTSHHLPCLVPSYGSSCKPLKLLTCSDVHHGPPRLNSRLYFECCGRSGCDHWPALRPPPRKKARHAYRPHKKFRGGIG